MFTNVKWAKRFSWITKELHDALASNDSRQKYLRLANIFQRFSNAYRVRASYEKSSATDREQYIKLASHYDKLYNDNREKFNTY